jgi:hypothetical protein
LRKEAFSLKGGCVNKSGLLKIVNAALFLCVLNQIITGLGGDLLGKGIFEALHPLGGVLTAILAAVHLVLNWAWVKANFARRRAPR